MSEDPPARLPGEGVVKGLEYGNRIYEAVAGAIAAVSAIVTFINGIGGVVQFLVQVGVLGFALYASLFVAVPTTLGLNWLLEHSFGRRSTEAATATMLVGLIIVFALVLRFAVFYDGIGTDFDAIGTTFAAAVGVAVLVAPLIVVWRLKGSQPK